MLKKSFQYRVIINFRNKTDKLLVLSNTLISELKQAIFDKYLLNPFNYSLYYKNKKLTINDFHTVASLFSFDETPLLFLLSNKTSLPEIEKTSSVVITPFDSNNISVSESKVEEMVNNFFSYKNIPKNANIKNTLKSDGSFSFKVNFTKPMLANEFKQFYNIKQQKLKDFNFNTSTTNSIMYDYKNIDNANKTNDEIKKNRIKLPIIKNKLYNKSISESLIFTPPPEKLENRSQVLSRVISNNNSSIIKTEKSVASGINIYHNSVMNIKKNKSNNNNGSNNKYEGMFIFPFMNPEEKYRREQYLDKKNWINKKGFIRSVGNYKMGNRYIKGYVSAAPSESPLNYKYREVNKSKWINKKGFFP